MDFIYLDEIINQYLSQYRLPDSAYGRIAQLAIRGRKELHLHSCGRAVTVPLEVQADNTLEIPADSLNILQLYVDLGEDKRIILEENENLSLPYTYWKDETNNAIRLGTAFEETEVMCEYLPQATQDGDYIVHPLFVEALIKWVVWEDGLGNPKVSESTSSQNERRFYNALRKARRALKPFSLDQMYKNYQRTATNNLSVFNAN